MREAELSAHSRVRWTIVLIALLGVLSGFFLKNTELLQGNPLYPAPPPHHAAEFILKPNPAFLPGF